MEDMYFLCSIDKLWFPSFRSSASNIFVCLLNHQSLVFFFFLLLSLPSSVVQLHYEGGNFFSEFEYYLEVSSSLLCVQEFVLTILSSLFSSSTTTFHNSPNTSAPIFLVSRSLRHKSNAPDIIPHQFLLEFNVPQI